jgi:hypothetical protein
MALFRRKRDFLEISDDANRNSVSIITRRRNKAG